MGDYYLEIEEELYYSYQFRDDEQNLGFESDYENVPCETISENVPCETIEIVLLASTDLAYLANDLFI